MNLFTRLTATLSSSVHQMVSHVENHEAIVEAALNETRAASAKAKVRLARLQKESETMLRTLQERETQAAHWEARARQSAESDTALALECVKRRNLCCTETTQITAMLARQSEVEREVGASVARIETRLAELVQQRSMMRSRHSAADALRVINRIEGSSANGIEEVFDRWEMRITETEYASGAAAPVDALAASFQDQESQESLKAELAALLAAGPLGAGPATAVPVTVTKE